LSIDYTKLQRSQIVDYLLKPASFAALQHLKGEIGTDVNSTDSSEPTYVRNTPDHDSIRGYE
jgi:hypothetical protein